MMTIDFSFYDPDPVLDHKVNKYFCRAPILTDISHFFRLRLATSTRIVMNQFLHRETQTIMIDQLIQDEAEGNQEWAKVAPVFEGQWNQPAPFVR
jgi:hypothetical protein